MEIEEKLVSPLRDEVLSILVEFFDKSKHAELSEEEFFLLTPKQQERYSACHPVYCPNYGRPMPHYPHVPLYPTYWA